MLIGIDASRALRARPTGTERYSMEIIRHLLRLPEAARHRWRLYSDVEPGHDLHDEFVAPGRVDVTWQVLPGRRLWTHHTLAREVLARPPDLLFVPAHVVPLRWPPQRLPPTVVTIHDLGYHFFPQAHTRGQRLYLEWGTRWSVTAAQRIIAVSQATASRLPACLRRVAGAHHRRLRSLCRADPGFGGGNRSQCVTSWVLHAPMPCLLERSSRARMFLG